MRIAVVCENINLKGGIARYVAELARRLGRDNEVHLITNDCIDLGTRKYCMHRVSCLKRPALLDITSFAIMSTLLLRKRRFSVVYSQGVSCLNPDIVVMQSCHKAYYEEVGKTQNLRTFFDPRHRVILALERYVIERGSKRIIAISNVVKEELLKYYNVGPAKISVIHSGVNLREFNPAKKAVCRKKVRARHAIGRDDVLLLFAGWEFERKGLLCILSALSLLKNKKIKLLVVGKGDTKKYGKIAEKIGVMGQVVFAGLSKNVAEYYAASDIFVFPTLYEPFGLVITEAMASGLPVVVSRLAGAAELIDNGKDGLLLSNPSNPKELADKIAMLARNRTTQLTIGRAARKTAESYSWDRIARQTMVIFKKVAAQKKRS